MSSIVAQKPSVKKRRITPHWEIRPYGAVSERVMVRLASDGVGTARSPSAYVTFVAYPYAHTVDPNEGPVEGGTMVRAYGHHFKPYGEDVLMRCVFGSRKSKALIISDTELQCTSPPVDGAYSPTGYLANFDLETIPAQPMVKGTTPASNQQPMKQLTFYYRRFVPSISWVEPLSGPEFGKTLVSLRSDVPILNSQNIKCLFGNIPVPLFMVTQNEATCTSPAFNQPGVVEFTLSADGQNRVQIGPNGEPVRFTYYITPTGLCLQPLRNPDAVDHGQRKQISGESLQQKLAQRRAGSRQQQEQKQRDEERAERSTNSSRRRERNKKPKRHAQNAKASKRHRMALRCKKSFGKSRWKKKSGANSKGKGRSAKQVLPQKEGEAKGKQRQKQEQGKKREEKERREVEEKQKHERKRQKEENRLKTQQEQRAKLEAEMEEQCAQHKQQDWERSLTDNAQTCLQRWKFDLKNCEDEKVAEFLTRTVRQAQDYGKARPQVVAPEDVAGLIYQREGFGCRL
eukprot:s2358_g1.t1